MSAADSSVETTNVPAVESTENTTPVEQSVAETCEAKVETPVVESTTTDVAETAATEEATTTAEVAKDVKVEVSTTNTEAPADATTEEPSVDVKAEIKTEEATSTTATTDAPVEEVAQSEVAESVVTEEANVEEPTMTKEEKIAKAKEIFNEGKKCYLSGTYVPASEKLSEALNYGVEVYGEFAVENYQNYYFYGKALLEIGRAEEDVLKTALKDMPLPEENADIDDEQYGNPETLTEEEREEIKEQVDDALAENSAELDRKLKEKLGETENKETEEVEQMETEEKATTEAEAETPAEQDEAEPETTTEVKEAEATTEDAAMEEGDAEAEGEEGDAEGEGDEEENEPSSIQAAWEILEVARKICDAQEQNKEWELNKADVYLALGECSVEDENYTQAVDDISVSIELYGKHMEKTSRTIARALIIMARAYKLNDDFLGASGFYAKAKESLVGKRASLESAEGTEEEKTENLKEVAELNELIADIDMKIEDAKESAQQSDENIAKIKEQLGLNKGTPALAEKTDAPAKDITDMVRKGVKRTAETNQTDESKRLKEINAAD
ncbi:unnamed protein product [Auanema sp. JU1783]|nr:unnamed protein product [Auanema sp. JU1783]